MYVPSFLAMYTADNQTPLARLPATSAKSITSSLTQFSQFLTSLDVLTTPRLALLSSSKLAEKVHRSALFRISQAYGEVCDRVLDKKEGYEFAETLLRRGKEEVAVALGVDGDESEFAEALEPMGDVKALDEVEEDVQDATGSVV
jgi:hypothetical protein